MWAWLIVVLVCSFLLVAGGELFLSLLGLGD